MPAVGDKVIRGPTWSVELPLPEGADYYEEGVVESGLLDVLDTAELSGDDIEGPLHRYQLGFQVYMGYTQHSVSVLCERLSEGRACSGARTCPGNPHP